MSAALRITQSRHLSRISSADGTSPAPSSACWVTCPLFVVQVPRLVSVDSFVDLGAWMLSQAAKARWVERFVLASETWVTVTMPPKATSVATAATMRRRPLNHFDHDDSRL
ncbi:hypothetical protein KRM28CT15_55060 [Krasilnikovia sp. M28-CT-15]